MRGARVSGFLLCLVGVFAVAASPATAKPKVDGKFDVSGMPGQITDGPGGVWLTLSGSSLNNSIARVKPNGTVDEFAPAAVNNPVGITKGPDGNIWVTQINGVVKIPPGNPNNAQDFTINAIGGAQAITTGPDGKLWTASQDQVIEIPPGDPTSFEAHTITGLNARGITSGGNGELWVADFSGRIVSVTTAGAPTFYNVGGTPQTVGAGPGEQIAYGNPGTSPQTIGRITAGGTPRKTQTPNTDPFGIALGDDGAYWFAQFATNNLGRLTPDGEYSKFGNFGTGAGPRQITTSKQHTLWVSLEQAQKVARVTGVEETPAPNTTITDGPDDKVKTKHRKAKVEFSFSSSRPQSSFECALLKATQASASRGVGGFQSCANPQTYRLKRGSYEFSVRATAAGKTDPTPATRSFKVVRKHRH